MTRIYVIIGLLVALIGGGLYVRALRADLALAETQRDAAMQVVKEQQTAYANLKAERDKLDKALAQRERDRTALIRERATLNAAIRDYLRADPPAQAWADQPVPAGIVERLRGGATAGHNAN